MTADKSIIEAPSQKAPDPLAALTQEQIMSHWDNEYTSPTISVCCITYNHAEYINDAIGGFLAQETRFPFEIIIRDDASLDSTSEIIRAWARQYPMIIRPILEPVNTYHQVNPLFAVMAAAQGKYLAICEGDDYWIDHMKLERQATILEQREEIQLVSTQAVNIRGGKVTGLNEKGGTRTYMLRSVDTLPRRREKYIVYADKVLRAMFTQGRSEYKMRNISAVWREHDAGVFTSSRYADPRLWRFQHASTSFWLCELFTEAGDRKSASKHLRVSLKHTIEAFSSSLGMSRFAIALWLLVPRGILTSVGKLKSRWRRRPSRFR